MKDHLELLMVAGGCTMQQPADNFYLVLSNVVNHNALYSTWKA